MRRTSRSTASGPRSPALFRDQQQKADLEARNALLQFDEVVKIVSSRSRGALNLTSDSIRGLQRIAIQDIYGCAGRFRQGPIAISGTVHQPPPWESVAGCVTEMCDYANSHSEQAIHVASYLMWRVNWIHPFNGGNGRTSRAASYLALCIGLGMVLPGSPTIPDQIVADRQPYYLALDSADAAWRAGQLDISAMESLVQKYLTVQLKSAI
jgi:hypothetical protein